MIIIGKMKTINLGIAERLYLSVLLPCDGPNSPLLGTRLKFKLIADIASKLDFTPKEIEDCHIKEKGAGFISFEDLVRIDLELSDQQIDIIKEGIEQADREQRIQGKMMSVINKIESLV